MSTESKRAVVEYKVTPFGEGKSKVFQRVIESAENSQDAQKQFWRSPIWPADTKKIEILSVEWPDEE